EYEGRENNFPNVPRLIHSHFDVSELQNRECRFAVRGIIRQVREVRGNRMKEVAGRSRITHPGIVYDECASGTKSLSNVPHCQSVEIVEASAVRALVGAAPVAEQSQYSLGPFLAIANAVSLAIERDRDPARLAKESRSVSQT